MNERRLGGRRDQQHPLLPPVHVLMFDAYGGGGVARTVINLANYLARDHDVEVISLFRRREEPRFRIDPRVRVTVLHDKRTRPNPLRRALARRRTRLKPMPYESQMSLLTDILLWRKLRSLRGVLISSRPSLHVAATTYAPARVIKVGQDHSHFEKRFARKPQANVMRTVVPKLDAYAVLTAADAKDYRRIARKSDTMVVTIPNALPWNVSEQPAPLDRKVVVTAGRLDQAKGHARMIRAYADVARKHPDWELHIYGLGAEDKHLEELVEELGLADQVKLMGYTLDLRTVLAESSIYALTSHSEGFSMVLIEAMSQGVPPVAMDCPRGPREIIRDEVNGRLVPDGDGSAFTAALLELIEDTELRRRLGRQAHEDARAYELDEVGKQWERLFADLEERRTGQG